MSSEPTTTAGEQAFAAWLDELPAEVRSLHLDTSDPFDAWLGGLSEEAAALAEGQAGGGAAEEEGDRAAARYGVVIVHSGEFPVVKLVKTPGRLAQLLGDLAGQDVCVACFRGRFLPVTAGPRRFVLLGDQAVSLPLPGEEPQVVTLDALLDDLTIQEDGFLGPEELANTREIPADGDDA